MIKDGDFNYQAWAAAKISGLETNLFLSIKKEPTMCLELMELHFSSVQHQLQLRPLPLEKIINLTTPGQKWYICVIGTHRASGNMKLAITLLAEGESPGHSLAASPDTSAARTNAAPTYYGWIVLILGIIGLA
ncbi:hypothetical protein SLEP1_g46104 [Rubroshorea leprosula]|uniref:Uncharacterized protein n=1 Tax=Rubroshorea leprosula TaxID=152421 RepID=A0AAV5LL97_9ROSI|nr:hypothetical protein SLEP1_g46104 [Rubroshorea leprosula]